MPRIPPALLRHARRLDPLLPSLLPVCRDLPSSQNELRWLGEHAAEVASKQSKGNEKYILQQYVRRRSQGEPLQYILGTEFFGDLEIKCGPGVLIPRQETAASVSHLAQSLLTSWALKSPEKPVNILDLCTGTGCIPLLLHHELHKDPKLGYNIGQIVGADVSLRALQLAKENKVVQLHEMSGMSESPILESLRNVQFIQADVLEDPGGPTGILAKLQEIGHATPTFDVLVSNPPYISSSAFRTTTAASVRRYEPKLALVPPQTANGNHAQDGDLFYPKLYNIASLLKSKVVLFEVADMEQACRVAAMANERWRTVEIWRDDPVATTCETEYAEVGCDRRPRIRVRGVGNGRSVVAFTAEGEQWRGHTG